MTSAAGAQLSALRDSGRLNGYYGRRVKSYEEKAVPAAQASFLRRAGTLAGLLFREHLRAKMLANRTQRMRALHSSLQSEAARDQIGLIANPQ